MQVSSNKDPESRPPYADSKVSSVGVRNVELDGEVVMKHLMADVDDD